MYLASKVKSKLRGQRLKCQSAQNYGKNLHTNFDKDLAALNEVMKI